MARPLRPLLPVQVNFGAAELSASVARPGPGRDWLGKQLHSFRSRFVELARTGQLPPATVEQLLKLAAAGRVPDDVLHDLRAAGMLPTEVVAS